MALDQFLKWITNSNNTKYLTKQAAAELHIIVQDLESTKSLFNTSRKISWFLINRERNKRKLRQVVKNNQYGEKRGFPYF